MKKMLNTLVAFAVLALAGVAHAADNSTSFRIHVPFAFTVGTQHLEAGDYVVQESDSGLVLIIGCGTGAAAISIPSDNVKLGVPTGLVFSNNHLVAVKVNGEGTRAIPWRETQERSIALSN
jgi:hypothetical protein